MRVGIVAGETSGDLLGGELIAAARRNDPNIQFEGMAGPKMLDAGCRELANISELSVMGLVEVVRSYPRLRSLRERLMNHFLGDPPDVFIGIDVPDFTLNMECRLRAAGVPTAHYVCPQVWAWREHRAKRLAESTDLLLAVMPFEPAFLKRFGANARYIGHPLADRLPLDQSREQLRSALGLPADQPVIAILPGSRTA